LEELAWNTNSPIYSLLNEQRPLLWNRLETVGSPIKLTLNACLLFASPAKDSKTSQINRKLGLFTRKVAHLAHIRIKEMVNLINNGSDNLIKIHTGIIRQIEYGFMHIMINTTLLQNRHIDQLLMCVLYSVCKINMIPVSFNQIVEVYRCIPHSNSQTFRMVRLKDKKSGDIITFYNGIFLGEMETLIFQLGVEKGYPREESHTLSSTSSTLSSNPAINLRVCSPLQLNKSPQSIPKNLVVSPRKTPLLWREEGSLILGTLKSPQSDFDKINNYISNRANTTKIKRKLDYGLDDNNQQLQKNPGNTAAAAPLPNIIVKPTPFIIPYFPKETGTLSSTLSKEEEEEIDDEDIENEEEIEEDLPSEEDDSQSPEKSKKRKPITQVGKRTKN